MIRRVRRVIVHVEEVRIFAGESYGRRHVPEQIEVEEVFRLSCLRGRALISSFSVIAQADSRAD